MADCCSSFAVYLPCVHADSCWAVAAAGAIEGLHKIQTGKLVRLSSQQIYDCSDSEFVNHYSKAFDWVHRNGGVASDSDYPYTGRKQQCRRETHAQEDHRVDQGPHGEGELRGGSAGGRSSSASGRPDAAGRI